MTPRLLSGFLLALLAGSAATAGAQPPAAPDYGLPPPVAAAVNSIDPERIRAHVRFLADDLLEGRGTGTRGGELAARYLAAQFALAGLEPAGDNGSYFQKVRFAGSRTRADDSWLSIAPPAGEPIPLRIQRDAVVGTQAQQDSVDVEAPVVFVGYGIDAPEYHWDDYKGVDVRGKIALILVNEPPSKDPKFFNGEALTYYGRWVYKYEQAARKGAIGAVLVHREDLASYPWSVVQSSWSGEQVQLADDARPKLRLAAWVQLEVARLLLAGVGRGIDETIALAGTREFRAFELPVRLKAHVESDVRRFESSNVVALLPGGDRAARPPALLYTAHYDHLGIRPEQGGDTIYNGAVDNATGCAMLLETARAWSEFKGRPARPILFAAVTAEEKGLLGSKYFGEHPPLPASQIALALNYDGVQPIGANEGIEVNGAERLNFFPTVDRLAKAFRFVIEPDPTPTAGHYYRSDHFSLARVGVPAFSIDAGVRFAGHPPEWGLEQSRDYVANRYHQPSDEYRPDMDFTSNALVARYGFALGQAALSQTTPIAWLPGDEFEAVRRGR